MILASAQAARFVRLLQALAHYANATRRIVPIPRKADPFLEPLGDRDLVKVLDVVWDTPQIIDEFVDMNPAGLPPQDLAQALRWKDNLRGQALLLRYDGADQAIVAMGDRLIAVTGVTRSLSTMLLAKPPIYIEITLLAFEDVITFASVVRIHGTAFTAQMRERAERERAHLKRRPVIRRADAFIKRAHEMRVRRLQDEVARLGRLLARDRIEVGEEALPAGVHRGRLAGLSDVDRERAVEDAYEAVAHEAAEQGSGSGDAASGPVPASVPAQYDPVAALMGRAQRHRPDHGLAASLDADSKDDLLVAAHRLGIPAAASLHKRELARAVAEHMLPLLPRELERLLLACGEPEFRTFRMLLDAPNGAVSFPADEAAEHLGLSIHPPFSRLFWHKGAFTAVVPREVRAAARKLDLAGIEETRIRARSIAHLGEVLVALRGIVPVADVARRCEELFGFLPELTEVVDALYDAVERDPRYPSFVFWKDAESVAAGAPARGRRTPRLAGEAQVAAWYLLHPSLGDAPADADARQVGPVGHARAGASEEACAGARAGAADPSSARPRSAFQERYRREWSRVRAARALEARDRRRHVLLAAHAEHASLGPCPLPRELAVLDVLEWEETLPAVRRLRAWLDAHVPDEEDDALFAEDAIERLLRAHLASDEPGLLQRAAADDGLFELTYDAEALTGLLTDVDDALPAWRLDGWSPGALA